MWTVGFWLLTLVTVLPLAVHLWRQESPKDYCEIIYPVTAYLYVGLGMRGFALCTGFQESPYQEFYQAVQANNGVLLDAFLIASLGVAALYTGYFSAPKTSRPGLIERSLGFGSPHSQKALINVSLCYGVLALLAACYMFFHVLGGSLSEIFSVTKLVVAQSTEGGQYPITGLARFAYVGAFVSLASIAAGSPGNRGRKFILWIALAVNVTSALAWFCVGSSKEAVFTIVLGLLLVWNYSRRRIRPRTVVVLCVLVLMAYPVLFLYRYKGGDAIQEAQDESRDASTLGLQMFLGRSHHFDMVVLVVDRIHNVTDLKFGSTFTELTYWFVPRAIWPGKPKSFGYTVDKEFAPEEFDGDNGADGASIVGELYANFYIPGVVVGMFLFGRFLKRIYLFTSVGRGWPVILAIYALFVLDSMHLIEGPIAGQLSTFLIDFIPVWMMGAVASRYAKMSQHVGATETRFAVE
jgi:hypothetical protein